VAQNAVKHGLLAQGSVIQGEDWGEFELFRDRMRTDLDPRGALEGMLADRVVNLAWRLRRAERLEGTALAMLEAQHAANATHKPAEGRTQEEQEAALARVIVEDFRYGKVLDRLLGYERRIENSLYRTVNELRKQRLIREVSGLKCQVSSEQSQSPSAPCLPTANPTLETLAATPEVVTTNGAQDEDELRQTNPIDASPSDARVMEGEKAVELGRGHPTHEEGPGGVTTNGVQGERASCGTNPIAVGGLEDRGSCAEAKEDVGRGRPSYKEAVVDGAQHSNLPSCQDSSSLAGQSCETKPMEVSSLKFEVSSEDSQEASPSGLSTSNCTLQTANGPCQVTSQPG
jgi:hypothetical protein